jgi:hypothetical protein
VSEALRCGEGDCPQISAAPIKYPPHQTNIRAPRAGAVASCQCPVYLLYLEAAGGYLWRLVRRGRLPRHAGLGYLHLLHPPYHLRLLHLLRRRRLPWNWGALQRLQRGVCTVCPAASVFVLLYQ